VPHTCRCGRAAWGQHCEAADASELKAIAARADQQHRWVMGGDPRGTYGGDFTALDGN
jgi:hypothetical protein